MRTQIVHWYTQEMSKDDYNQSLLAGTSRGKSAVDRIPILAKGAVSDRARRTLELVRLLDCSCATALG